MLLQLAESLRGPNRVTALFAAGYNFALEAYAAGRVVYVPGKVNSVQTTLSKIFPRAVVVRAAKFTMRKLGRA